MRGKKVRFAVAGMPKSLHLGIYELSMGRLTTLHVSNEAENEEL